MIDTGPEGDRADPRIHSRKRYVVAVRLVAIVVAVVLLLTLAGQYRNFLEDDALISATYAQRLLEGKGLTWTDGSHVEGYSNLLWVLALALVGLVEPNLVVALRVLAVVCFVSSAAILGLWGMARGPFLGAASIAAVAFVTSGPVSVWTFGGLEQPLFSVLLVSASGLFLAVVEDPEAKPQAFMASGFVFGLLCLVRPDAPLWFVPAGVAVLVVAGKKDLRIRRLAVLSVGPVVALGGVEIFRTLYYDAWVPNTALVKLNPSGNHFGDGWRYTLGGWGGIAPIAFMAGVVLLVLIRRGDSMSAVIYLGLGPLFWSVYLVFIGGGIFSGYRHFVPIVAVLAVVIARGGDVVFSAVKGGRARAIVGAGIAVLIGTNVAVQMAGSEFQRAKETSWVWAGRDVAHLLVDAFGTNRPLLAVTAAGSIPFWTGFQCIDMLGLNDRHIARHRPEDLGEGFIGHEHGDGAYVLSRKPDIIQPCGPWGGVEPCYRAVREMYRDGSLQRLFEPVTLRRPPGHGTDHIHTTIWLRRDSPRVGVRETEDSLVIPATFARPEGAPSGVGWVSGPDQIVAPMRIGHRYSVRLPQHLPNNFSVRLNPPMAAEVEVKHTFDSDGVPFSMVRIVPFASEFIRSIILTSESEKPRLEAEEGEGSENLAATLNTDR